VTLPERGLSDFGPLANVSMEASYRRDVDALAHELAVYSELSLLPFLSRIAFTLIVDKPQRALVVERTDGRHCWLSVGKTQTFEPGCSGWVSLRKKTSARTVCGDAPWVVRPSVGATITCLSCLARGLPPHLQ